MKIWSNKIDNKYPCFVERVAPYTGFLVVQDPNGHELLRETTNLAFGARFGPDAEDVNRWIDRACTIVDAQYRKT